MTKTAPHTAHTVRFTYNGMTRIGKYVEKESRLVIASGQGKQTLRSDF